MPVIAPPTFADIWPKVDAIPGWMTYDEAALLYQTALRTPEDGTIVEIGSFCGRSLTLLAETGRRIISVDPLVEGESVGKKPIDREVVDRLRSVVDAYSNIEWQRCFSAVAVVPPRIDMLHIDACHKYPFPRDDFRYCESALVDGAFVAFHDYGQEHGATRSVTELVDGGLLEPSLRIRGTMCVTKYRRKGLHG